MSRDEEIGQKLEDAGLFKYFDSEEIQNHPNYLELFNFLKLLSLNGGKNFISLFEPKKNTKKQKQILTGLLENSEQPFSIGGGKKNPAIYVPLSSCFSSRLFPKQESLYYEKGKGLSIQVKYFLEKSLSRLRLPPSNSRPPLPSTVFELESIVRGYSSVKLAIGSKATESLRKSYQSLDL